MASMSHSELFEKETFLLNSGLNSKSTSVGIFPMDEDRFWLVVQKQSVYKRGM